MASDLTKELNQLLSDYHIYYQNTRGFHWNIRGKNFFELHRKFEELYTEALQTIDELAERILTIGGQPMHTFTDYTETSTLKAHKNVAVDDEAVRAVHEQLGQLVEQESKVKEMAVAVDDQETEDMMVALINGQQKTRWMLEAWLG
ncbi:MAG: DNA starvation/stationary phase protection protein [Bacteroidota bacterium]